MSIITSSTPLVTVLMAVHNGERFLTPALTSILTQTHPALELLVVNDGSTDSTAALLAECSDSRLRVLTNPERLGLARSLNLGIDCANGSYIARMDADDVCHPQRIEQQVHFMENHPDVGLLGTACRLIDEEGNPRDFVRHPSNDAAIRWRLLLGPSLAHPSVMIRVEVLRQHGLRYDQKWPVAQDYELWPRLLRHCRGANLPAALLDYRLHKKNTSTTKRQEQDRWAQYICERESTPFLSPAVPLSTLAQLRRMLAGELQADDPPASRLRLQLLLLVKTYLRHKDLKQRESQNVKDEAVATALMDGAWLRPVTYDSMKMLKHSLFLAPKATIIRCLALLKHYCADKIMRCNMTK